MNFLVRRKRWPMVPVCSRCELARIVSCRNVQLCVQAVCAVSLKWTCVSQLQNGFSKPTCFTPALTLCSAQAAWHCAQMLLLFQLLTSTMLEAKPSAKPVSALPLLMRYTLVP